MVWPCRRFSQLQTSRINLLPPLFDSAPLNGYYFPNDVRRATDSENKIICKKLRINPDNYQCLIITNPEVIGKIKDMKETLRTAMEKDEKSAQEEYLEMKKEVKTDVRNKNRP